MAKQENKRGQQTENVSGGQENQGKFGHGQYDSQGKPNPLGPRAQDMQGTQSDVADQNLPDTEAGIEGKPLPSNLGGYENSDDDAAETAPDQYGDQDQFGDVDGQDPYTNLGDEENEKPENRPTPRGDRLEDIEETEYGLAEPLAKPGDRSYKGKDRNRWGTRGSQDQYGYQK